MTFTLHVEGDKWRKHVTRTLRSHRNHGIEVAPVVKGNGYGFGRDTLAREAAKLGANILAIGTVFEVERALAVFPGACVVLEPFLPDDTSALAMWRKLLRIHADRLIVTVAGPHLQDAAAAGATRLRVEGATSMHRFGMTAVEIDALLRSTTHSMAIEGLTLHLPISEPEVTSVGILETPGDAQTGSAWLREVLGWVSTWREIAAEHGLPVAISVSHLTLGDLERLTTIAPDVSLEARIGTELWLGEPDSLRVTGTVLAQHTAGYGYSKVGYTQVDARGSKRVIVVSGGTSHGVALAAPTSPTTLRRRTVAVAQGLTQAIGKVRSPFRFGRTRFTFVEPPHMHVSMLWCDDESIQVGSELECRVRHTVAHFDVVTGLD